MPANALRRWYDQMPGPGSWLLLAELISGPHQPNLEWLQASCPLVP